ncbi:MAG: ferrochelatase [Pseudomonadota bacterium]
MTATNKRVAVVLFNLGGPDSLDAVRPFLFNLFNDGAIISAPGPLRWCLAQLISRTRASSSQKIYAEMGGASPLLDWTSKQARALEEQLAARNVEAKAFIAMRYWKPLTADAVEAVRAYDPDEIVLLPLYPQFSTTTTGSSLAEWQLRSRKAGLNKPVQVVCCYPEDPSFIKAHANVLEAALTKVDAPARILFSAHGLPEQVIEKGDPYQSQVEKTSAAVMAELSARRPDTTFDWSVCYQSRVGPLKWIGPSTDEEIARAAADKIGILLTPIAFVSEHVETLVELDIEYRQLAEELAAPFYVRAPALGLDEDFIDSLAESVVSACGMEHGVRRTGPGACAADWTRCPMALECSARRAA